MDNSQSRITSLLSAVATGDADAANQLFQSVYAELHRVAKARLARESKRGDLQTTVLVQEVYLRLMGDGASAVPMNRQHFFAAAANAMRQFLVDNARMRGRQKRGGGRRTKELGDGIASFDTDPAELMAIDDALTKLQARDERKALIVQLRFFTGLSIDDTADVLGLSPRTVDEEWRFAKAWLHRELS